MEGGSPAQREAGGLLHLSEGLGDVQEEQDTGTRG